MKEQFAKFAGKIVSLSECSHLLREMKNDEFNFLEKGLLFLNTPLDAILALEEVLTRTLQVNDEGRPELKKGHKFYSHMFERGKNYADVEALVENMESIKNRHPVLYALRFCKDKEDALAAKVFEKCTDYRDAPFIEPV